MKIEDYTNSKTYNWNILLILLNNGFVTIFQQDQMIFSSNIETIYGKAT